MRRAGQHFAIEIFQAYTDLSKATLDHTRGQPEFGILYQKQLNVGLALEELLRSTAYHSPYFNIDQLSPQLTIPS